MNSSLVYYLITSLNCSTQSNLSALIYSSDILVPPIMINMSSVIGISLTNSMLLAFEPMISWVIALRSSLAAWRSILTILRVCVVVAFPASSPLKASASPYNWSIIAYCSSLAFLSSASWIYLVESMSSIMRQTAFIVVYCCSFSAQMLSIPDVKELIRRLNC